ncbi:MAG: hypothetical protein LBI31_04545 [Zoogloeaceae bacterium]|jgi:hypothetical protein|nr:hypothetical protein [Zoogloeaceae bacterium]
MNATAAQIERPEPKSYLTEEEKVGLSHNLLCAYEADAARDAGDEDSFWRWLAYAELPDSAKDILKYGLSAEFLAEKGFNV